MRILIDTNVFVAAACNPASASRKIVRAVERGELRLVVSPAVVREYEVILPHAVRWEEARDALRRLIESAQCVSPQENPPVTEDRADDKFLAAAVTAPAEAIITSDRHLLAVHPYQGIDILPPPVFWKRFDEHEDNLGESEPG
jgi:putative PIN family toxin of toxin-antitoxin system